VIPTTIKDLVDDFPGTAQGIRQFILEAYRRGFEDGKQASDIAASGVRESHGDLGWNVQMVCELIEGCTPERWESWKAQYRELNHREYVFQSYRRVIEGRR
jgi:hypothetical protein